MGESRRVGCMSTQPLTDNFNLQIPTIYEVVRGGEWPDWLRNIHDVSHSLIVFNSAVNFLLYTFL